MDLKKDRSIFITNLLALSEAIGEPLTDTRLEIYFQDLADFPLSEVLQALTWARKNLTHFPKIAELRTSIEGDPEAHADKAWQALRELVHVGPGASVIIPDRVMAKVMQDTWGNWPYAQHKVGMIDNQVERWEVQKTFKRAYEAWKHRDSLPSDVRFKGEAEIAFDRGTLKFHGAQSIRIDTYSLVDGKVTRVGRRDIPNPDAARKCEPMPPEIKARVKELFGHLGRDKTRDAYDPAVPGRQNLPAVNTWDIGDTAHGLGHEGLVPAPRLHVVPDAGGTPRGVGCTCSGAMVGGACTCSCDALRASQKRDSWRQGASPDQPDA